MRLRLLLTDAEWTIVERHSGLLYDHGTDNSVIDHNEEIDQAIRRENSDGASSDDASQKTGPLLISDPRAVCKCKNVDDDGEPPQLDRFKVEHNVHRPRETRFSRVRFDDAPANDGPASNVGVALPSFHLDLLRHVLWQSILNPKWGHPERVLNVYEANLSKIAGCYKDIELMISTPMPLPYIQHYRLLLLCLLMIHPLLVNPAEGVVANVVIPVILGMALVGFTLISEVFDNPFGMDDCDYSVCQMIHSLEVSLENMFNTSEHSYEDISEDWSALQTDLGLRHDMKKTTERTAEYSRRSSWGQPAAPSQCRFDHFFEWLPSPTWVLHMNIKRGSSLATIMKPRLRMMDYIFGLRKSSKGSWLPQPLSDSELRDSERRTRNWLIHVAESESMCQYLVAVKGNGVDRKKIMMQLEALVGLTDPLSMC
jgi:hypothetical protein